MNASLDQTVNLMLLKQRDHQAFASLVKQYHRQMLTVARAIIGESQGEEVVQDAWIAVFHALPDFEGRSSLKTWIYAIVSNQAKSRLRKDSRLVTLEDWGDGRTDYLASTRFRDEGGWRHPPSTWQLDTPDTLLEEEQLRHCIEQTLTLLNPMQKAVFTLRDIEQQSLQDICNILGLGESNVRVLLHRARLKLMQVIDHYQETGHC